MAKLHELLTSEECFKLGKNKDIYLDTDVKNLTIEDLSSIALIVINTRYNGMMPACVLSAECIVILVERAIERNISIL